MVDKKGLELPFGVKDIHGHTGTLINFNVPDGDGEAMNKAILDSQIEEVCFSPFIGLSNDATLANEAIQALSEKYSTMRGLALVNPYDEQESEKALAYCFEDHSFAALKFHPYNNHKPDNDPGYFLALQYANRHKLAILWHYGGGAEHLGQISKEYPDANFILAHYGTAWNGYTDDGILDILRLVAKYDNVYTDLAGSSNYFEAVAKVINVVSYEKLLFGSDFGFLDGAYQMGQIVRARISDQAKYAICCGNYNRLVKPR